MKEAHGDGCFIEPQVRQDVSHIQRMDEVGFAGVAHLPAMGQGRENIGLLQQLLIEVRTIALDLVEDVFEADHDAVNNRMFIVTVSVSGEQRAACGQRTLPPARRPPLAARRAGRGNCSRRICKKKEVFT